MTLKLSDFDQRNLSELKALMGSALDNLQQATTGFKSQVEYIDSIENVEKSCSQLKQHKELAFDCEGVRLGRGGNLTLIQIMAKDEQVFIFDVLVLGKSLFDNGMKEILESTGIIKIMFDCRCDSDSLWEEYKVELTNVLDMQLFEFMVRPYARTQLRGASRVWHYRKPCIRGYVIKTNSILHNSQP